MEETGKTAMAALERFIVIAQVTCYKSMMPGNNFYHPHVLLSKSLLNKPVIKHTAGTCPWFLILKFQVRQIGAGRKILQDAGGFFGLPYLKHLIFVISAFTVDTKRGAEGGASV